VQGKELTHKVRSPNYVTLQLAFVLQADIVLPENGWGWKDKKVSVIDFIQFIFCINFTLSCTMFELIIFEILDVLENSSRIFHWYFSLYAMLVMLILITPFYLVMITFKPPILHF